MRYPTPLRRGRPVAVALAAVLVITTSSLAMAAETPPESSAAGRTTVTPSARVASLIDQMTLEEKLGFVSPSTDPLDLGSAGYIRGVPRLGVPELRLTDGTAGIRLTEPATALPVPVMLGSTFDPDLAYAYGHAMGQEGRALGQDVLLAPMVNIIRVPQGGRNFETFSEDPLVTAQMASAEVAGVQDSGMIATAKHYALNNQEANKNAVSVDVTEQALHEVYLPGYAAAVDAGAGAVMCAYNKVGVEYSCGNDQLLNGILKTQLGFQGWVMSDWGVTHASSDLMAGLDQEMYWIGQQRAHFTDDLRLLLEDGSIPVAAIDDAVARILGQMEAVGLLDGAADHRPELDSVTTRAVAQQVAEEGATLLKNDDGTLPLGQGGTIALIGPTAQEAKVGGSGSAAMAPGQAVSPLDAISERGGEETTVVWDAGLAEGTGIPASALADPSGFPFDEDGFSTSPDLAYTGTLHIPEPGSYTFAADASAGYAVVSIDGSMVVGAMGGSGAGTLELTAGTHSITVMGGGAPGQITLTWITPASAAASAQAAAEVAADSDVAIVFVYDETSVMADRPNLSLPSGQDTLVEAVAAANPRTVVVLNTGSAVTMPWIDDVAAVLDMYYPGTNGAQATARLLYGDVNPSGKLTQTFPASDGRTPVAGDPSLYPGIANTVSYAEGVDVGYRWYTRHDVTPLFPFGHGLSYTTFAYSEPTVVQDGEDVMVSLTLTNTGDTAGKETVQVYAGPSETVDAPQPERKLVGFLKVGLEAGASQSVEFPVGLRQLESWNTDEDGWELGTGVRTFWIGTSSAELPLVTTVTISDPAASGPEPTPDPELGAKPEVRLVTTPAEPSSGWHRDDVQVSAEADGEGIEVHVSVDSGPPALHSEPVTLSDEGVHTVSARATGTDGVSSDAVELTVRIDKTPPAVTVDSTADGVLTLSATDALSGVAGIHYSLDGGTSWATYAEPVEIADAPRVVGARAVDVAGNTSAMATGTVQGPADGAGAGSADGRLAVTGSALTGVAGLAALMVLTGLLALWGRRRRRLQA